MGPHDGEFIKVVQFISAMGWRFLTAWYIPGTRVTPAEFLLAMMFVWFVLRHVVPLILGGGKAEDDGNDYDTGK